MELQLRSTMILERLISLMILHVYNTFTDSIIITDEAKEFVNIGESHLRVFDTFNCFLFFF